MTPVLFRVAKFLFKMPIVAYLYITQSKYMNTAEIKQKQRPMTCGYIKFHGLLQ